MSHTQHTVGKCDLLNWTSLQISGTNNTALNREAIKNYLALSRRKHILLLVLKNVKSTHTTILIAPEFTGKLIEYKIHTRFSGSNAQNPLLAYA